MTITSFWTHFSGDVERRIPLPLLNDGHLKNIHRTLLEGKYVKEFKIAKNLSPNIYIEEEKYTEQSIEWIEQWLVKIEGEMNRRKLSGYNIELNRSDIMKRFKYLKINRIRFHQNQKKLGKNLGYSKP